MGVVDVGVQGQGTGGCSRTRGCSPICGSTRREGLCGGPTRINLCGASVGPRAPAQRGPACAERVIFVDPHILICVALPWVHRRLRREGGFRGPTALTGSGAVD
jgi:hypothetical protein